MDFIITQLPKDLWKGHILRMDYTTTEYYDTAIKSGDFGFDVSFNKVPFDSPITHTSEEIDFPDKLFQDHSEGAYAWGIINGGELIAAIETCPEEWSNRLLVTELWVDEKYRRRGLGHALIAVAKEQARHERRRAVILETQSCNTGAIGFYLSEGFILIGFDSCCYSNSDIERKEVRMDMGWFPAVKEKLEPRDIIIRPEQIDDWYDTEYMTKKAFWNKHSPGCNEHFLVHKLRGDSEYIPELSRVAEVDGKIVGCIMYSKSYVTDGEKKTEVLTFGPLCVDPEFQSRHVGGLLLTETMKLASGMGYRAIIIFGEPDYYPLFGFKTCDHFGITTPDGGNFPAFMGIELLPGGLENVHGKFYEAEVFEKLPPEEADEFDRQFPYIPKLKFPKQWA